MRKTTSLILSDLFAALTALGAYIRIPTPVSSFSLQILFTAMAGCLLGRRWGAASQIIYVLLGLAGLPVFTTGGGLPSLFHPTGGFLIGMIAMAWICGWVVERRGCGFWIICLACAAGLAALYAIGLPWMHLIMTVYHKDWTITTTLVSGMLLFLPWDILKIAVTALLCARLRPALYHTL